MGDIVLLEMIPPKKTGLIITPDPEWPWEKLCRVVALGPEANLSVKPGDLVALKHYHGDPVANRHHGMITVKAEYVIAQVEEDAEVKGSPRDNW